jgi:hypothetical protein
MEIYNLGIVTSAMRKEITQLKRDLGKRPRKEDNMCTCEYCGSGVGSNATFVESDETGDIICPFCYYVSHAEHYKEKHQDNWISIVTARLRIQERYGVGTAYRDAGKAEDGWFFA